MQALFNRLQGDKQIWMIVSVLSIFSILAVYSATGTLAFKNLNGNTEYFLLKQLLLVAVSLGLIYTIHLINHNYFSRLSQILLYLSVPLLLITLFFGTNINEASRWLTLPVLNISFQTSDLAKLALIMYTARMLSKKNENDKNIDSFVRNIVPILLVCMLIIPADLSTGLLLFITCLVLMFIGRVSWRHIGLTIWLGITIFSFYVSIASLTGFGRLDTWQNRFVSFIQNEDEKESYQIQQSKVAIANGGLIRIAPGRSIQRNFLPHPYSDFIYAIIIEEYGLFGGLLIMVLYLAFLRRSIRIFQYSPGKFGALLAVGLSISLVIQAMMNMAVTVGLLPVTGLTLPLVSMGGTSLLFTGVAIGIILSVSRYTEAQNAKAKLF